MPKFEEIKKSILNSKTQLKVWQKFATVLSCFVVFATVYLLILPALTLNSSDEELQTYCLKEEHTHTIEECYESSLVCELHVHNEDCYEDDVLVCELESHEHNEECFESVLVCDKQEHTHTKVCYADVNADKDLDKWLLKAPAVLTENWPLDVLTIANSQVGYHESNLNYIVDDNDDIHEYSIYGDYYDDPYGDWNLYFINFVLDQAQIPSSLPEDYEELSFDEKVKAEIYIPRDNKLSNWIEKLEVQNLLYISLEGESYYPQVSDVVFFENEENEITRVGLVSKINYELDENEEETDEILSFLVIEADDDGIVTEKEYELEDNKIVSFMMLPINPNFSNDVNFGPLDEEGPEDSPLNMNDYVLKNRTGVVVKYHNSHEGSEEGREWFDLPTDGTTIPGDAHIRFEVLYKDVDPAALKAAGYKLEYTPGSSIKNLKADGEIKVDGVVRGTLVASEDKIVINFSPEWVNDLVERNEHESDVNKQTIKGDFYFQGQINLDNIDEDEDNTINLGPVKIDLPLGENPRAQFGQLDITKASVGDIFKVGDKYYLEYVITVNTPSDRMDDVVIKDVFANKSIAGLVTNPYCLVNTNGTKTDVINVESFDSLTKPFLASKVSGSDSTTVTKAYLSNSNTTIVPGHSNDLTPIDDGDCLVWEIGNMKAGETRTLTYFAEINPDYIGVPHTAQQSITNTASAYSKGYPHNNKTTEYLPHATGSIDKSLKKPYEVTIDGNKYYRYDYTVKINIDSNNIYDLTNVKLIDDYVSRLMTTGYNGFISYISDSVHVYSDEHPGTGVCTTVASEITTPTISSSATNFTLSLGTLNPGKHYCVTYSMLLDADEAVKVANGNVGIYNEARLTAAPETKPSNNVEVAKDYEGYSVFNQTWESKTSPGQIREGITQNASGDVYDGRTKVTTAVLPTLPNATYTIPAGAFKYVVDINTGSAKNFDMSGTQWKDTISNNDPSKTNPYIKLIGYIQVDVYSKNNVLKETKWVYVDGQSGYDFNGQQIELDPVEGDYYRLTYYGQAQKYSGDSYGVAYVGNEFEIGGTAVGNGGDIIVENLNFHNKITSRVEEPGVENPTKDPWYYDPTDESFINDSGYLQTGAAYWFIEERGSKIPQGASYQESVRWPSATNLNNYIRKDISFIGFYTINLEEVAIEKGLLEAKADGSHYTETELDNLKITFNRVFKNYKEFTDALNDNALDDYINEVPSNLYTVRWSGNWSAKKGTYYDFSVNFPNEYSINSGERLFILVRTEPKEMPDVNESLSYTNKVNYYYPAMGSVTNWPNDTAEMRVHGPKGSLDKTDDGMYKVTNSSDVAKFNVEQWDTKKKSYVEYDSDNKNSLLQTQYIVVDDSTDKTGYKVYKDGVYVVWNITLNKSGEIDNAEDGGGEYTVLDTLPQGVELAYVRGSYLNSSHYSRFEAVSNEVGSPKQFNLPSSDNFPANEGWTLHTTQSNLVGSVSNEANDWLTYYYTKTSGSNTEVGIYVPKIYGATDGTTGSNNRVSFQVVCRVTDPNIYMEDVDLINTASFFNKNGKLIEADSSSVTAFTGNLNKTDLSRLANEDSNEIQVKIPYSIVVNELQEDMESNADILSVALLDHMSKNLSIDMNTLKIYANFKDLSNPGTLIYDNGVRQELVKDNGNQLYYATDLYGNRLYWQNAPSEIVDGTLTTPYTSTTVNSGLHSYPVISTFKPAGFVPVIEGQDHPDAIEYNDGDSALYYVGIGAHNEYTYSDPTYAFIKISSLNDVTTGLYKIYAISPGRAGARKFLSDQINNGFIRYAASANVADGAVYKITKLENGRVYIQNSNNEYVNIANSKVSFSEKIAELEIVANNSVSGNPGYAIKLAGSNAYFNAQDAGVGIWSQADTQSSFHLYKKDTEYKHSGTNSVGSSDRLYWNKVAKMGSNPTDYPVVSFDNSPTDGIIWHEYTYDGADSTVLGNIDNSIQLKDADGKLLYFQKDAENNYIKDANGLDKMFTVEDGEDVPSNYVPAKKTQIKIAVEDYYNEFGNSDGSKVVKFQNLPDGVTLGITYQVTAQVSSTSDNRYSNESYWEEHKKTEGGSTDSGTMQFTAGGNASLQSHGAVKITKYNGLDTSKKLAGATFALYRAEYVLSSPGHNFIQVGDNLVENTEHNYPAIYKVDANGNRGEEMKVVRNNSGLLQGMIIDGTYYDIENAKVQENVYEHQLKVVDGKLQVDKSEILAEDTTNAAGVASYGFADDATRIHFNKVYAIVETVAPEGFEVDPTPHFFVVPSKEYSGDGPNYFYHSNEADFPSEVHITRLSEGGILTYFLNVYDYKANVQVTKEFDGNGTAENNHVPGTYSFGIWARNDVLVKDEYNNQPISKDKMLSYASVTYEEDDFGYYKLFDNGVWNEYKLIDNNWNVRSHILDDKGKDVPGTFQKIASLPSDTTYGILPGHTRLVTFSDLEFYHEYFVYELDKNLNPITSVGTNQDGNTFEVNYQGDESLTFVYPDGYEHAGETQTAVKGNRVIPYRTEGNVVVPIVIATNKSYSLKVDKRFFTNKGLQIENGLTGTYKFGIWRAIETKNGSETVYTEPNVDIVNPLDIQTIKWTGSIKDSVQSAVFKNLYPGKYYVYELDDNNKPIHQDLIGVIDSRNFEASYSVDGVTGNEVTINKTDTTVQTVDVNNKVYYVTLPHTGGMGIPAYIAISLVTFIAILVGYKNKFLKRN